MLMLAPKWRLNLVVRQHLNFMAVDYIHFIRHGSSTAEPQRTASVNAEAVDIRADVRRGEVCGAVPFRPIK